jgi:hypothetical protein
VQTGVNVSLIEYDDRVRVCASFYLHITYVLFLMTINREITGARGRYGFEYE